MNQAFQDHQDHFRQLQEQHQDAMRQHQDAARRLQHQDAMRQHQNALSGTAWLEEQHRQMQRRSSEMRDLQEQQRQMQRRSLETQDLDGVPFQGRLSIPRRSSSRSVPLKCLFVLVWLMTAGAVVLGVANVLKEMT
jgi:hypothetical protein